MGRETIRKTRTEREVKLALLALLEKKSLDSISMTELAKKAEVSRSTLYQHYANVAEVYSDVVNDLHNNMSSVMTQAACYSSSVHDDGKTPFCELLRTNNDHEAAIGDPRFIDTFLNDTSLLERHDFFKALVAGGYRPEVAQAVATFQVNGCFKAVRSYGADEELWNEVRDAIDTFICGGIDACLEKKRHTLMGHQRQA